MTPHGHIRNATLSSMLLLTVLGAAMLQRLAHAAPAEPPWLASATVSSLDAMPIVDVPTEIIAVFDSRAGAAMCIAGAESGWRADAIALNDDGSRDRGVFQINSRWHPALTDSDAFNITENIRYAHALSHGGIDWSAWSSVTRQRCGM